MTPSDPISLAQWRRAIAELYARVRQAPATDNAHAHQAFRAARDELFRTHVQSPLNDDARPVFTSLIYYPYDPAWRLIGSIDRDVEHETFSLDLPADGPFRYTRIAEACFHYHSKPARLSLYWVEGYGGGLFVPFLDETNAHETYGGGRYLFDTIKGADLGVSGQTIVLDFNYAYNPSCAYDDRWACPLAPPENRLPFAVPAGEKSFR